MKINYSGNVALIIIFMVLLQGAAGEEHIIFDSAGTQTITMSVPYNKIKDVLFNFTGSEHNGYYPSNISFDIGNDGSYEWEYKVYHSTVIQHADTGRSGWSTNPDDVDIQFRNMTANKDIFLLDSIGKVNDNVFTETGHITDGELGIVSSEDISSQVISFVTNTTTIHAFLPKTTITAGNIGYYVAEGGSTYYCNTDHTFLFMTQCNLFSAGALIPSHLARKADWMGFNFTEPAKSPIITEKINDEITGCGSPPCSVTIAITSETPGELILSDYTFIPADTDPAEISITDAGGNYHVEITPDLGLTSVGWAYGEMPKVYIVPFVFEDEPATLDADQTARLEMINDTIASEWDNLTEGKHPLDFYMYMEPIHMDNLTAGDDYAKFVHRRLHWLIPNLNIDYPAILITLDINDHFDHESNNVVVQGSDTHMSRIYINGFNNNSKTGLYRWDEELLMKNILHELAHTFLGYPGSEDRMFYTNHPASFTDNPSWDTYSAAMSPTGNEGYYDFSSIMNQVRFWIADEDTSMGPVVLTDLDKMLLGIKSRYEEGNYTFYEGTVTDSYPRHSAGAMTPVINKPISDFYDKNSDENFWDILKESNITSVGTSQSFDIPKTGQGSRAIFVWANDSAHPGHFKASSLGAQSQTTSYGSSPITSAVTVESITSNKDMFTIADAGADAVSMIISFSGSMDTTVDPDFEFDPDIAYLLSLCSFDWQDDRHLNYTCNLVHIGPEEKDINVTIIGAKVPSGLSIAQYTETSLFSLDIDPPNCGVGISDTHITDSDTGDKFIINLNYDEDMNTSINPDISFSPVIDTTLINCAGSWSSSREFRYECDIADANTELSNIDVVIKSGEDLNGNEQNDYSVVDAFNISMGGLTSIEDVSVNDTMLSGDDAGQDTFRIIADFSSTMDTNRAAVITLIPPQQSIQNCSGQWANTTSYVYICDFQDTDIEVSDIDISVQAYDSGSNDVSGTYADLFSIDTIEAGVDDFHVSDTIISRADIGGIIQFTVWYSEGMDTSVNPTVTFEPDIGTALAGCSNSWANSFTYRYSCSIVDSDIEETNVDIDVSGAKDSRGNSVSHRETNAIDIDLIPPTVNILSPGTGTNVNKNTLIVFDDDEGTNPECSIDNINFISCTSGMTRLGNITGFDALADDKFTLYIKDTDAAGNTGSTSVSGINKNSSFSDDFPPSVTLISPDIGTNEDDIEFICRISDDINTTNVTLYGSWGSWHANETINIVTQIDTVSFNKSLPEGVYDWNCKACDSNNQCSFGKEKNITVDRTSPGVVSYAPGDGTTWTSASVVFSYNATDNLGISICALILDGQQVKTTGSTSAITMSVGNGVHSWFIRCMDKGGNTADSQAHTLTVSYTESTSGGSSGGGGGGSSGGGGGSRIIPSSVTAQSSTSSRIWLTIKENDTVDWTIDDETIVQFTGRSMYDSSDTKMTMESSDMPPKGIPPVENSYKYINLKKENIDFDDINLKFKVNKSFGPIRVLKYNGRWSSAPHILILSDDDYDYYESDIGRADSIAIQSFEDNTEHLAAETEKDDTNDTVVKKTEVRPVINKTGHIPDNATENSTSGEIKKDGFKMNPWIVRILILLTLVAAIIFYLHFMHKPPKDPYAQRPMQQPVQSPPSQGQSIPEDGL